MIKDNIGKYCLTSVINIDLLEGMLCQLICSVFSCSPLVEII